MTDDMFQTQGVLVRLQEDNTMGHVARVLASQHRQRQQEWPSLLQGTGLCKGISGATTLQPAGLVASLVPGNAYA
eukprot:scaffold82826_cov14-Tisochrysis_lutea.AAC.1